MKQSKQELTESLDRETKLAETLETLKEREADLLKELSAAKDEEKRLREMGHKDPRMSSRRESELANEPKVRFASERNESAKYIQKLKVLEIQCLTLYLKHLYLIITILFNRTSPIAMKSLRMRSARSRRS